MPRDPRLVTAGPPAAEPASHTHEIDEISGLRGALAVRVRTAHQHTIAQITGLEARLAAAESLLARLAPLVALIQSQGVFGLGDYEVETAAPDTGAYGQPPTTTFDGGTYEKPSSATIDGGAYIWSA